MQIISLSDIKNRLAPDLHQAIQMQEDGFVAYSKGQVIVPPVGYLGLKGGDCHIKYGLIREDKCFVVKIATGSPNNPQDYGISATQGVILVLSTQTGQPLYLLQDQGYLTSLRTALAGLIAAKYLGPKNISAIGILGTGEQARLQIKMLKKLTPCRTLWVWGRSQEKSIQYSRDMAEEDFTIHIARNPQEVAQQCNLIITTTASNKPLLMAKDILPGTHITAVGADCPGKNEIDPKIFSKADICVVDSRSQCIDHGDTHYAVVKGLIGNSQLVELGEIIVGSQLGRTHEEQITIADLTGVAVQDIQIAKVVLGL